METAATIALWLFVINLGTVFGAGIYEHRILIAHWLSSTPESGVHWSAEAARRDDVGLRFWAFASTWPLTLLTVANLGIALGASGAARTWWLTAALVALIDRILSFGYFIPRMVKLMKAPDRPESVAAATRWVTLNHLRHAIVLIAWLLALKTLMER